MSYAEEQVAFLKGLMAGWPGMAREMMESILATLSVPSSERVAPAGWKLVPVEPTAAMLKAAWSLKAANAVDTIHGTYRAMLDAAPTAEARAAITGLSREEYDAVVRDAMQWRRLQIEQDKSALSANAGTREQVLAEAINVVLSLTDHKVSVWGWQRAVTEAIRSLYQRPNAADSKRSTP